MVPTKGTVINFVIHVATITIINCCENHLDMHICLRGVGSPPKIGFTNLPQATHKPLVNKIKGTLGSLGWT